MYIWELGQTDLRLLHKPESPTMLHNGWSMELPLSDLKWNFSQNYKILEFFTNFKFEEGGWLVREGFTSQDYMNRAGMCPMTVLGKVPVADQVLLPYPKGSFVIK